MDDAALLATSLRQIQLPRRRNAQSILFAAVFDPNFFAALQQVLSAIGDAVGVRLYRRRRLLRFGRVFRHVIQLGL